MKLYRLFRQQWVPAPLEEVFAFFDRPENLNAITPPSLHFRLLTPSPVPMHQGALIDYSIRLLGVPMRWTTYIAVYEPPHCFVDVQLRGPYSFWHHTHRFVAKNGGTEITDEVLYVLPFGLLGRLAYALWVRRQLEYIFAYRRERIAELFGSWRTSRDPLLK
ncbi:hypothetical protein HRbin10_00187 [bacterium HR10]|nr:hypothetical protein HRbin10_00187 [bacterium HR10]